MFSDINTPSAKAAISTAASVAASAMVVRSIARDLIPYELRRYVFWNIQGLWKYFSPKITVIIEEFNGLASNQIYEAAEMYLGSKIFSSTERFRVSMPAKETKILTSMARNQEIEDIFDGTRFKWRQVSREVEPKHTAFPGQYYSNLKAQPEIHYFELSFHKKHKQKVFDSYFPFILEKSKSVKEEKKTLKLYTLYRNQLHRYAGGEHAWQSINLHHPATFDTLAMEPSLKKMIKEDLDRFVKRKELYKRVGKAWKRGYLLYGPPGTGKSSLIAAMANYLNFDIYDLELTGIHANSDLRTLLLATGNRSILVIEDIDCSLELQERQTEAEAPVDALRSNQGNQAHTLNPIWQHKVNRVTLSGFLNFVDGLWSSCGDERIIVFTTNHKDKLDPALLRPGRMDVHINMSYCTPCGFKILAANYLGITEHPVFPEIEELLEKTMATPAEVGEQLLKNEEPDIALGDLIEFLQEKMTETDKTKAGEPEHKDGQVGQT